MFDFPLLTIPEEKLFPTIECRKLGRTDLSLSVLGFGASPLGNVFGEADPKEAIRAVHFAVDYGINCFDVSPYYGITLAEERLGEALEGRRSEVVLATKCGRYGADEFDFSAKRVRRSVDESLRRLRTDYIDLLQAHDVEFGNFTQITDETIPAMRLLQEEGKVRYVGISGYPLHVLVKIAEIAKVDSILSYCRYNLLVNDMDTVLMPFAEKHGIGVINASALHMGLLTMDGAPEWHPAPPKFMKQLEEPLDFATSTASASNNSRFASASATDVSQALSSGCPAPERFTRTCLH